jgi:5-formyltetrahydrofolate cyclo-ligase
MIMSEIDKEKRELRKAVRERKNQMADSERRRQEELIFTSIEQMPEFQAASHVFVYWSLPDEVHTHAFIDKWYRHKKIYLPVIDDVNLKIGLYEGVAKMSAGVKFGISEPVSMPLESYSDLSFAIIPGVAFDDDMYRLGRGGGFYDRLLPQLSHVFKVGIAYNEQKVSWVPVEAHDIRMDCVVTAR